VGLEPTRRHYAPTNFKFVPATKLRHQGFCLTQSPKAEKKEVESLRVLSSPNFELGAVANRLAFPFTSRRGESRIHKAVTLDHFPGGSRHQSGSPSIFDFELEAIEIVVIYLLGR
jgi:hypothetical protein